MAAALAEKLSLSPISYILFPKFYAKSYLVPCESSTASVNFTCRIIVFLSLKSLCPLSIQSEKAALFFPVCKKSKYNQHESGNDHQKLQ